MSELNIETLKAAALAATLDKLPVIPKGVSSDSAIAIRDLVGTLEKHDGMIPRCAWHAKAIRELLALIERLQVAEDAANDAERYQFLRSRLDDDKDHGLMEHKKGCDYGFKQGAKLDAAIDAAIAAKEATP